MIFRFISAAICTILFAGSWCLSQYKSQMFWLSLSLKTYLIHVGIWLGLFLIIYFSLSLAQKRSAKAENKLLLFFFIVCFINLIDFGVRSLFGDVGHWPKIVLVSWAAITIMIIPFSAFLTLKLGVSRTVLKKMVQVIILPCLLLLFYALPTKSKFSRLEINYPLQKGEKAPVHLILFDMLSYEFLMPNGKVLPQYTNFHKFSQEACVFTNAYSPSDTTGKALPTLLTGKKFVETSTPNLRFLVKENNSTQWIPLGSVENLFSVSEKEGYNIFLRAFCIPYLNHDFGNSIQSGKTYPFDTLWRVGMHSLVWPILSPGGIQNQKTVSSILYDYLDWIKNYPNNTFFFTHWNIPHDPFLFDENGNMLSRWELVKRLLIRPNRKKTYQYQIMGTDSIFGQVIQTMKENDKYNESLVIIMADHNIKGFEFDMKHIPLVIKEPYQKGPNVITDNVNSTNIMRYLKHYYHTEQSDFSLLQVSSKK